MIDRFSGEYAWLSNFWPSPVTVGGRTYPTVEHAYQASKTTNEAQRRAVADAPTPGQAKRAGRHVTLREDWDGIRLGVMYKLVRQKFGDAELARRLLATGDELLVEGNTWGDAFWGVYQFRGENHLGKILMRVRGEIS
jgi:ribA/ribD-fused uncharacterized protein